MVYLQMNEQLESSRLIVFGMQGSKENVASRLVLPYLHEPLQVRFSSLFQAPPKEQVEPSPMAEPVEEITTFPAGSHFVVHPNGLEGFENQRGLLPPRD